MEQERELYKAISLAREFDPDDPVLRNMGESEYEVYKLLRRNLPVFRSERTNHWYYFRYDDCREALQHPEIFSNDTGTMPVRWIPQQTDPPEQREYRRILDPMFSPQVMAQLEPDIRAFANDLLDPIIAKGECEFIEEFALPFPCIIFCRLVGFPVEDFPKIINWELAMLHGGSTVVANRLGIPAEDREPSGRPRREVYDRIRTETSQAMLRYLTDLLEQRRREPRNDVLTKLTQASYSGSRPLTHDEQVRIAFLLFLAGLDTVTGMLGMIIHDFARHPEHRQRFVALMHDDQKVASAIEELVRFHTSVPTPRRVTRDCTFRGLSLRQNDMVTLHLPAADRDDEAFVNADEIVYDREPNPHLGFGLGPHRCLGIHLARRELKIGLQEIHKRMPNYRIKPGAQVEVYTGGLRGLYTLPLVLD
jgi:cytochrome P450